MINKAPSEPSLVPHKKLIKQTILAKIIYQSIIRFTFGFKTSRQRLLFWEFLIQTFLPLFL